MLLFNNNTVIYLYLNESSANVGRWSTNDILVKRTVATIVLRMHKTIAVFRNLLRVSAVFFNCLLSFLKIMTVKQGLEKQFKDLININENSYYLEFN